jgi:hypothetical protein
MPRTLLPDIRPLDLAVYRATIDEFVNCLSRQEGVKCIGQCGSIGSPGVSDLDLLVVCEDEQYKPVRLKTIEFAKQSPLRRYLFCHEVGVVPRSAVTHLLFVHSLENLHTLWGDSEILESCEQPDAMIVLFREVLWNSCFWNFRLHLCGRLGASLRYTLSLSKSSMMAAVRSYYLSGNKEHAHTIAFRAQQEIQRILSTNPRDQCDAAKEFLWEAVQTLAKSDWELSHWISQKGLLNPNTGQQSIQLSHNHIIVFDDSYESSQGLLHQHIDSKHITYFPAFYKTIGRLVARPYLYLEPELSNVWGLRTEEYIENKSLMAVAERWNEVLLGFFSRFRMVGGDPMEMTVFPFQLRGKPQSATGPLAFVKKLTLRMLPVSVSEWLRYQRSNRK